MTRHVVVRPEAAGDIEDAYNWYERARTGLGEEFLAAVREGLDSAIAHPEQFRWCIGVSGEPCFDDSRTACSIGWNRGRYS